MKDQIEELNHIKEDREKLESTGGYVKTPEKSDEAGWFWDKEKKDDSDKKKENDKDSKDKSKDSK